MSQVKANTFRARKKAILEWDDSQAVVEPIHEVSVPKIEDFWKTCVVDTNVDFAKIQKSIRKDWLKFGHMIMSQGLKEISAIEMSLARP